MTNQDPDWVKDADEAVEQSAPVNNLPEAPASATVRVWIDGYGVLITTRDNEVGKVIERVAWIMNFAKENNWKPSWKEQAKAEIKPEIRTEIIKTETETAPQYKCDTCGAPANYRSGVKNNRKWAGIFCSANGDHVKWITVK